jgi:hypothetical protein
MTGLNVSGTTHARHSRRRRASGGDLESMGVLQFALECGSPLQGF